MHAAELPKISADAHVDEPHDLWFERLAPDLRDRAPRRIQAESDGGWTLVIDDSPLGWSDVSAEQAAENEEARIAAVAPDARFEMMRADGVNAEIIYPTIGLYAWNVTDPVVGRECCRVYNDWILERLGGTERIRVAAMIPTWDVEMAIEEVRRVAAHGSVGGLLLPLVGTPEWNLPGWEPLWSTIEEVGIPAVMHQGTGHDMIFYRGWGSPTANLLATQSMAPRAAGLLSCSGVLERHPDLHVVMVEVNAGWMAWTMSTLDEYYTPTSATAGRSPSSPSSPATTSVSRCTPRSRTIRSRSTTSRSPAPTACSGATTSRTPRARTPTPTRCSTACWSTSPTPTRTRSCSTTRRASSGSRRASRSR